MKILLSSRLFYPSIGGGETNAEILAREFVKFGHEVVLVTRTPGRNMDAEGRPFPFPVIRVPNYLQLAKLIKWSDVYLQNGISLRDALPLLFLRKPWVIRHLTWIDHAGANFWIVKLKYFALQFATSIAISQAVVDKLPVASSLVPNPYRDQLFRIMPEVDRKCELVFVGRLVSDKGCLLLLEALALLKQKKIEPHLSVVGEGPERDALEEAVKKLGLQGKVNFYGRKTGEDLVRLLNQHHIMVVPSLWEEPFGVVALEGIACGCVIIGSEKGGLKEAIGPCGLTFPNGDVVALAGCIEQLLSNKSAILKLRCKAAEHLSQHQKSKVAQAYLHVLKNSLLH